MPVIGRHSFGAKCIRCGAPGAEESKVRAPSTADKPAKIGAGYFHVVRKCKRCGFTWKKKQ